MKSGIVCAIALVSLTLVSPAASAGKPGTAPRVVESALFDPDSLQVDSLRPTGGVVDYVYFQALRNTKVEAISFLGEPMALIQDQSYFLVDLFETTANWETPGGNDDRIFAVQVLPKELGRARYAVTVPSVTLRKGKFYRLGFQVANMGWAQPYALNDVHYSEFPTSDKRFLIFGSGNPALVGPVLMMTPTWFIEIESGSGR